MPIDLTDEQRAFAEAVRDFCARELGTKEQRDTLTEHGREAHNPELYAKVAELGWLGATIPEEYGGSGAGMTEACIFLEETARGMAPLRGYNTCLIVAGPYRRYGTEEQKRDILGGIAAGKVESIAMSEPEAGSDVANISCRAVRSNGDYVVNGQKTWISNATFADHILLIARTSTDGGKHHGLTMLNVPADTPGVEIRPIDTMGGREVNDIFFTDCRVPAENVVGTPDQAWKQLMSGLNGERLIVSAMALGMAQRAFDDVLAYIKERRQFSRPIGTFQVLRHRIADLATEIECARLLVYDIARRVDADPAKMLPREASMAKLKTTEIAKKVALEGMQMMGGYGYATEYDMESHVRQTLVSTIYAGTSEIQRDIIAGTYGLREPSPA